MNEFSFFLAEQFHKSDCPPSTDETILNATGCYIGCSIYRNRPTFPKDSSKYYLFPLLFKKLFTYHEEKSRSFYSAHSYVRLEGEDHVVTCKNSLFLLKGETLHHIFSSIISSLPLSLSLYIYLSIYLKSNSVVKTFFRTFLSSFLSFFIYLFIFLPLFVLFFLSFFFFFLFFFQER